jgi:hypothetical protein
VETSGQDWPGRTVVRVDFHPYPKGVEPSKPVDYRALVGAVDSQTLEDDTWKSDGDLPPLKSGEIRVSRNFQESTTGKIEHVAIHIDNPPTDQASQVLIDILPKLIENFLRKNADYASSGDFNTSELLGSKGQFAELWRKIGKLKGAMWDGKKLVHEQTDEILEDLGGHVLLALLFIKEQN